MNLQDLSVTRKLVIGFATLVVVVAAVAALAVVELGAEHGHFSRFVTETSVRRALAEDVLEATYARAIAARDLVLVSSAQDKASEQANVTAAHMKVGDSLAKLKDAVARMAHVSERERQLVADIETVEKLYGPVATAIVELALAGRRDEAIARIDRDCRPLLARLVGAVQAYGSDGKQRAVAQIADGDKAYEHSRMVLVGSVGLAVMLAAVLGVTITRAITRPIRRAVSVAQTVAAGDLRSHIDATSRDETGQLLAALKAMNLSLTQLVTRVRNTSESIATGSVQIAAGSLDLSRRTELQAAGLQQTAASMEQMNATVRNSADVARQASALAASASGTAEEGGRMVGAVVSTMNDIADSSRRIADIIGTIDGIAFQTNILALNAAVEAARAGEQGRGFAVVASEVRGLAQRSAEAAREIKVLIGTSVEQVETGTRVVAGAGTTMDAIVSQVRQVAELIAEISSSTQEQTSGISQVNDAVTQLDQATQQNAALVEESSAAAESLKQQAQQLASAVAAFKVG
jgi:methyl-accepting chemotaxis protein